MEMVLFLESLVEAATVFCFLHAVTDPFENGHVGTMRTALPRDKRKI